jgi:hypothetical protein
MVDTSHAAVTYPDPPATLPEREPVRVYGTTPVAILSIAGAIVALGVGSPVTALGLAAGLVVLTFALELVRSRVSPAPGPAEGQG